MAKLDKITIRGFKSIEKLEDFKLESLNVPIGANGAGKSNFQLAGLSLPRYKHDRGHASGGWRRTVSDTSNRCIKSGRIL
jgi:recombinational DNA repair ATPase RecF